MDEALRQKELMFLKAISNLFFTNEIIEIDFKSYYIHSLLKNNNLMESYLL